ncbi:MAG TPA: TolC family protein [Thermoanaerobaculia bacterium]|jgi:outer membrane protein
MLSLFLALQVLTLGDAVSLALQQNPSQQVALSNAAVADEQAAIADAARWPVVTADARVARWQMKAFLPKALLSRIPEPISVIGPTNDFSAGVDVRYTVWDSGRRDAEIGAARAGATAAHADVDSSRVQLAYAVHEAYFRLLATNAAMDAARARLGRAEDHVRVAAIRKEEGASPQIDVVRARVEVARAKADVASAQADAAVARGLLNTLLGQPPETPLELAPVALEPADDAIERPELAAQRARIAAQKLLVSAMKRSGGPRVGVQGAYGLRDDEWLADDQEWSIGVGVEVDLFDRARRHRVARANNELAREEARLRQLQQQLDQEVWSARANVREARAAVDATVAAVTEAQEALRLARARYDAGAGTINDLLDAEAALTQAESLRIQTVYAEQVAISALRRASGRI